MALTRNSCRVLLYHRRLWTLLLLYSACKLCHSSQQVTQRGVDNGSTTQETVSIQNENKYKRASENKDLETGTTYSSVEYEYTFTVSMTTRKAQGQSNYKLRANKMTEKELALYTILQKVFHTYFHGIFGFIAIGGNCLTLLVLLRNRKHSISPYTYMTSLAGCDLISGVGSVLIAVVFDHHVLASSLAARQLFYHTFVPIYTVIEVAGMSASLLAMVLGVDRMIAVQFPLKRHSWCTVPRARGVSILILISSVALNLHTLFRLGFAWTLDGMTGLIMPRLLYTPFGLQPSVNTASRCITFIFRQLLPLVVMSCTNTLTLYKLYQSRRSAMVPNDSMHHSGIQCLGVTIGVIIAFAITHAPKTALQFISMLDPTKRGTFSIEVLTLASELLAFSNATVNFFIYSAFNTYFREDLKLMFQCHREQNMDHVIGRTESTKLGSKPPDKEASI